MTNLFTCVPRQIFPLSINCLRGWLNTPILSAVAFLMVATCAGCAGSGPYRTAEETLVSSEAQAKCQEVYRTTDDKISAVATDFSKTEDDRTHFLEEMHNNIKDADEATKPCWQTAYEKHVHSNYDLYYAEFDDAGQATDLAGGTPYEQSELYLIKSRIINALRDHPNEGLNIVVFTHGWHGNARADDDYSIEFKAMLQDIAAREETYSKQEARAATGPNPHVPHHVLGIEIAWRGDSFLTPALPFYPPSKNAVNVWDRKLAAEILSTGAVQDLLAFLNEEYLANSCHSIERNRNLAGQQCDRVHLLSIGHSFGALINFRALTPRLASGLSVEPCHRVFGFGDMTILLNPAFEGARYRALFNSAKDRPRLMGPYVDSSTCKFSTTTKEVQIPSVVTLQSLGDSATGTFFPLFRSVSTSFEHTLSKEEESDKIKALGWVPEFRTHILSLSSVAEKATRDECRKADGSPNSPQSPDAVESFCPFRESVGVQADRTATQAGTHNQWVHLTWDPGTPDLPNYLPLWSVAVQPEIMADHDDIWNPQIVRLISVLFEDAYEQTERMHRRTND